MGASLTSVSVYDVFHLQCLLLVSDAHTFLLDVTSVGGDSTIWTGASFELEGPSAVSDSFRCTSN